ncbi:MAG: hypothetical protein LBD59_01995 [Prevotellaceae bacterium]|jgi:tetratricopeptide (TPR) repeat protein|nr:hypothetical protein [Prevotellaceae bacterium]
MEYTLQIQKLLLQLKTVELPTDRIALLKQAIKHADVHNDTVWGFDLRLNLIREEKYTSHCDESLQAFTWILDTFDNAPGTFLESNFLWEYKWMLGSIRRNSSISMEQIEIISEDYRERLTRNGYSLRSYYTVKLHMAFFLGQMDEAKKYLDLRNKEIRDDMSNCRACELDDDVELELRLGNFDKAIVVGNEVLTKKVTCGHMPFSCYCHCVKYFQQAGNMEKALEYFQKAEDEMAELTNDTSLIAEIGIMLRFLTDYDREKAWRFFEQYVHWNIDSEDYLDFLFSKSVLSLLSGEGCKTLKISPIVEWYRADDTYDQKKLYDCYRKRAEELAAAFDKRNGSNWFTEQLNNEIIKIIQ